MTFEEIIEVLFPYLYSIRRLKTYLSFDLIFPSTWEFPNHLVEKLQVTQNEGSDGKLITSIVTVPNDMSGTLSGIQKIIYHNLEREEKEKLFQTKVEELKVLFEKQTLKSLKTLKFEIKNVKIQLQDDEEEIKNDKLA
jgi:hypothetical protein